MSSTKEPLYCLCGQPYDPERFMIQCDVCKDWFHGSCTGVKEHDAGDIIKYHCPNCQLAHGPSKWKVRTNWHRHDYSDPLADGKKVQSGTHVFVQELKNRKFRSGHEVTTTLAAHQVTVDYLRETSFMNPILVSEKEDLGLTVPPDDLTIGDIVDFLGAELMIDVIDVLKQESTKMTLGEFAEYYTSYNRTKVFNVVSLEFTEMRLSEYVRPPSLVTEISWVENCWPKNLKRANNNPKPAVMKYCLIGTENSYTDFHIDFGGSSVWYHVLQGEKVFYLIRPTEDNLVKYERWMAAKDQSEIFLGDEVDACFRLALQAGQTLFIPTGWIHAVLTTTDSIVFGGNFLHSFNIGLQLSVYEMEQRLNCPSKFMFPSFETLNWFAAASVIEQLKDQSTRPPMYLVNGAKALCSVLRRWTQGPQSSIEAIPNSINVPKLIKDLSKEVKCAEKKFGKKKVRKENLSEQRESQPLKMNLKSPAAARTTKPRPSAPPTAAADLPAVDALRLAVENISLQCDRVVDVLDRIDHRRIPRELLIPLQDLVEKIRSSSQQRKRASVEASIEIFEDDIRIREDLLRSDENNDEDSNPAPAFSVAEPIEIHVTTDMCHEVTVSPLDSRPNGSSPSVHIGSELSIRPGCPCSSAAPSRSLEIPGSLTGFLAYPFIPKFVVHSVESVDGREMYDFSSDDEGRLVVEENAPSIVPTLPSISSFGKKAKKIQNSPKAGGLKLRLSIGSGPSGNARTSKKIDCLNISHTASDTDDLGSPEQEQEAIQGMLSMSGTFNFSGGTTVSHDEVRRSRTSGNLEKLKERLKAKRAASSATGYDEEEDEFERALKNCKPEDDFVYLGIDANDEETKIFKRRGKTRGPQRHDEAWNPKGVSLKGIMKGERPQREGVKREVMESTLAESKKFVGPTTPSVTRERREPIRKKKIPPTPRIKEETISEPR
ncbi:lysine-specific demethylase PHF2, partial [Galendromus occidentalis]|uniref:[histone H3]-dimethyl-L-lysine(36) demethylase n=1 Tax=Galendromus occidentalis TaxID=34638 RepID=A0AAJ6VVI5_9ACAR